MPDNNANTESASTDAGSASTAAKIVAIAWNTFREAVRNRILYIILVFAILLLIFSGILREFTIADHDRIIQNFGMAAINFFGVLIAIFIGISLIYNEIEKKTIYTIISKPIDRGHFLLGKYFGLLLTIYINVLIMSAFFLIALHWQHLTAYDAIRECWVVTTDQGQLAFRAPLWIFYLWSAARAVVMGLGSFVGLYETEYVRFIMITTWLTCLELAVITAFALLYSTFSSPTLSAIFTLLTFVIGRLSEDIFRFAQMLADKAKGYENLAPVQEIWHHLAIALCHLAPNLALFNRRADVIYEEQLGLDLPMAYSIGYGLAYSAMVLALATLIFRRRNFK